MPLLGVSSTVTGAMKLTPVNVIATVVPCSPCTGVNPRSAGAAFGVVPHPAGVSIPGGQLFCCAAVMVNGVAMRRSWSASTRNTWRLPNCALAAICTCAVICVDETAMQIAYRNSLRRRKGEIHRPRNEFAPLKVIVTVEPAAACVGVNEESEACHCCCVAQLAFGRCDLLR